MVWGGESRGSTSTSGSNEAAYGCHLCRWSSSRRRCTTLQYGKRTPLTVLGQHFRPTAREIGSKAPRGFRHDKLRAGRCDGRSDEYGLVRKGKGYTHVRCAKAVVEPASRLRLTDPALEPTLGDGRQRVAVRDKTPIRCGCKNVSYRNISSQLTKTEWRLKTGDQLNRRAMFQMDTGIV